MAIKPLDYLNKYLTDLVQGRLWLKVLLGMVLGIVTGIIIGPGLGWVHVTTANTIGNWLALPGQLFLTLVQMIVIPLVFASVVRSLDASESLEQLKKMGIGVVVYFVITTIVAIIIGLWITSVIKPGSYINADLLTKARHLKPTVTDNQPAGVPDLAELPEKLITLLPDNPLTSMVEGQMLQVVIFAMIIGMALVMMNNKQAQPMRDLIASLQEVCMTVVGWAMRIAPVAVFGLMAQLTAKIGFDALLGMAVYIATVLLGLLLLLLMYLFIVFLAAGERPLKFLTDLREVMLLAFSTSSSAAVMPMSIKTVEEKLGVNPSVSQFVIPLGTTINMNGTALYQGVAAVFLAQVFGIELGAGAMLLIIVTAVGASIGSPGTPGVGLIILAMVLESVNIPAAGIVLIMGVDRILDMSRTAVNVCGDIVAAKVMNRWLGKQGEIQPQAETI